jgi:TRAP-type mannitol/chloroaromatic compound transport system substrate-binding protein
MKRRKFLTNAAVGASASVLAGRAAAQSLPNLQWRMVASWPKSLDVAFGAMEFIARRVGELTEGRFQIRAFAGGEIVPAFQVLDAVQAGTVEMGNTALYFYFGKDPAFAFGTALPFGMTARQNQAWWYFGGGAEALAPLLSEYGCVAIPSANSGCQMGGWFRREIKSTADLKGLKFRIGGMAGLVLAKVGAVPQMIPPADIYPALEKGTIDGAEWVGPYDDEKLGFNKVAQYYYYPGWWDANAMVMTLINEARWKELPRLYQNALTSACAEANVWAQAKFDAANPAALRRLVAGGTKLRRFPKEVMEACEAAAYEVFGELMAKSEHWKRIYPAWKKFRDEQFLWFRVAENSYDNYAFYSKLGEGK